MKSASGLRTLSLRSAPRALALLAALFALLLLFACKHGPLKKPEMMYVSVSQANLHDRISTVYNKVATVNAGEAVEVIEKQKRWVHVKISEGKDGWLEERYLIGQDVYDGFEKLKTDNAKTQVEARGTTRAELNIHLTPDRESDHLFQMKEGDKADVLKKASSEKNPGAPKMKSLVPKSTVKKIDSAPAKASAKPAPDEPPPMEDWWLIRDSAGHVGWVLGRMIDIDVPVDVAQYAESQRITGYFILNKVHDGDKDVPQYLVLMSEPRDGLPYDYDSVRVFSWDVKRHRYETAYRERNIVGVYPVTSGVENFGKEGDEPVFTIQVKDETGAVVPRKYRMIQPVVRRVLLPGQNEKGEPKLMHPAPIHHEAAKKKKK